MFRRLEMTAEQKRKIAWLNRAYYADKKLNALIAQRNRLEELAQRITMNYRCNDKGKSSGSQNGTENALMKLAEIDLNIDSEIKKLADTYIEIYNTINQISDSEAQAILRRRYLAFETMEQIAESMNYDVSTINRKHKKILDKLPPFAIVCHFDM